MSEWQALLVEIEKAEGDAKHDARCVYADWLDEAGEPEEAERQRKYEPSKKWLKTFAVDKKFGRAITQADFEKYDREFTEGMVKEGDVWVDPEGDVDWGNPYEQLMRFLERHCDGEHRLSFETPYGFAEYSDELWNKFKVITGLEPPEEFRREMPPFRCSC